jgi:hypothetical protein
MIRYYHLICRFARVSDKKLDGWVETMIGWKRLGKMNYFMDRLFNFSPVLSPSSSLVSPSVPRCVYPFPHVRFWFGSLLFSFF